MTASPALESAADVTVVIPAWDGYAEHFLSEALASVATQVPSPAILIVDNASIPPVLGGDVRVLRTARRLSVGGARTAGLEHVDTPYVMFWDADDVMAPGTIRLLRDAMEKDRRLVLAATRIVHEDGTEHHWPRRGLVGLTSWPRLYAAVNMVSSQFPTAGSAMIRTDVLRRAGGFPSVDHGDDWAAGVSLALRGRVRILDFAGRIYRTHPDSVSASWTASSRLRNARHVRQRLSADGALPLAARLAVPLLLPAHWLVLLALRPLRLSLRGRRARLMTVAASAPAAGADGLA